jgi:hypothetical protein
MLGVLCQVLGGLGVLWGDLTFSEFCGRTHAKTTRTQHIYKDLKGIKLHTQRDLKGIKLHTQRDLKNIKLHTLQYYYHITLQLYQQIHHSNTFKITFKLTLK